MKLAKYLGSVAFVTFSTTMVLGHWETNPEFENLSPCPTKSMVIPKKIIESYYQDLRLKNTPKTVPFVQAPFFDFNQPLTTKNVATAIAAFLHAGETPEALLICQKVEDLLKECDYDKRAAKRQGMQEIFKEELKLVESQKKIKPELQLTLQKELNDLEARMNQGLEKALKFSHEKQKAELLLALDAELAAFLQTRNNNNKKLPLISTKELYNSNERTEQQIEEKFVKYEKNPPALKRTQAIQQIEIQRHLDQEMDLFKIRLKNQKDIQRSQRQIHTISFYTAPSTEKDRHEQNQALNKRSWAIKAKEWEQGKAKS